MVTNRSPAKCHEQATLRKLWRQTGNSTLLPAKCWPLLHVIAGISAWFSNFAFVLFCYTCITNHLMTGPLGNSGFCFPRPRLGTHWDSRETKFIVPLGTSHKVIWWIWKIEIWSEELVDRTPNSPLPTWGSLSSPDVSRDEVEGNIRTLGKTKLTVSLGTIH